MASCPKSIVLVRLKSDHQQSWRLYGVVNSNAASPQEFANEIGIDEDYAEVMVIPQRVIFRYVDPSIGAKETSREWGAALRGLSSRIWTAFFGHRSDPQKPQTPSGYLWELADFLESLNTGAASGKATELRQKAAEWQGCVVAPVSEDFAGRIGIHPLVVGCFGEGATRTEQMAALQDYINRQVASN